MPKIAYQRFSLRAVTLGTIAKANEIIEAYQAQGFKLTVRQLYYQFVSRDLIPNNVQEYKKLASVINDGRMAGLIDWDAIEDRTRNLAGNTRWRNPQHIIDAVSYSYRISRWKNQPYRPEVWIEKEALAGVFEGVCSRHDIDYFCCRGYTSQSEMWAAAQRLRAYERNSENPQKTVILHFGDHDPSGIDMSRDITDRLATFGSTVTVKRIALTMAQVDEFGPPPNPAKTTDARFAGYQEIYGDESWELDALEPATLAGLVDREIALLRDDVLWSESEARERTDKKNLKTLSEEWDEFSKVLGDWDYVRDNMISFEEIEDRSSARENEDGEENEDDEEN